MKRIKKIYNKWARSFKEGNPNSPIDFWWRVIIFFIYIPIYFFYATFLIGAIRNAIELFYGKIILQEVGIGLVYGLVFGMILSMIIQSIQKKEQTPKELFIALWYHFIYFLAFFFAIILWAIILAIIFAIYHQI